MNKSILGKLHICKECHHAFLPGHDGSDGICDDCRAEDELIKQEHTQEKHHEANH